MRLAIVSTHPIQYYAPWFRDIASKIELEVLYAHRQDAAGQGAAGFGVAFEWDVPLLEGYAHRWLRNESRRPGLDHFGGCDCPEVRTVLRDGRYDAVLLLGWNQRVFLQAFFACRKLGLPVLSRGDSHLGSPRHLGTRIVKALAYRWFLPRFDAHLVVGKRNHEYLRRYGVPEAKLHACPHFVDNEFFASRAARLVEDGSVRGRRAELGIDPAAVVFLFVGKLIQKKRASDFARALAALSREEGVRGVVVGDGPLRGEVERAGNGTGRGPCLVGFKNQSELPLYYALSDAIVLPSDGGETWGLVVNEAMACGKPAVVSDACGCAPDLVEEGVTGFTFPVGDVATLGGAMRDLAERIRTDPAGAESAVRRKISGYTMEGATAGLARALESVRRRP